MCKKIANNAMWAAKLKDEKKLRNQIYMSIGKMCNELKTNDEDEYKSVLDIPSSPRKCSPISFKRHKQSDL